MKFAVNARGRNEAERILFRHRNHRGITSKPFPHCRIASCSRHTATFIRRPDVAVQLRAGGEWGCRWDRGSRGLSMVQLSAFRRSLRVALALCSMASRRRSVIAGLGKVSSQRTAASPTRITSAHHARRHLRLSSLPASSRGVSRWEPAWRRCRPRGFAEPMPASRRTSAPAPGGIGRVGQLRFVRPRRRSAPLSRRQSDRPRQPVVRALHEHGAAAHRPSRHRLGHGEFVRAATASASPARRSAPSR